MNIVENGHGHLFLFITEFKHFKIFVVHMLMNIKSLKLLTMGFVLKQRLGTDMLPPLTG